MDFVESAGEHARGLLPELPGSELAWLQQLRKTQLDNFLRDGLPGRRDEPWKYTSLRAFGRRPHQPGDPDAASRDVGGLDVVLPGVTGPRLVFVHGVYRPDLTPPDDRPLGLELLPFSAALANADESLQAILERPWDSRSDAFARLNTALAAEGVVLRVQPGRSIKKPVHVVHIGLPDDDSYAWHMRDIIELGEGASLKLVEHYVGPGKCKHLATRVADVRVGKNAELDWTVLQEAGEGQQLIRRERLHLAEQAKVRLHVLELGGGLVRHELDARLAGDGASLDTRGVFVPHGRQHIDTHLDIRQQARDTRSDSLWRGVADERGRGVLHGAIVVEPGADGTDAKLSNKNLLLSKHAEIDSQPVLEIWADEVMAEHGSTVGQLDEQALFYMRARGIAAEDARAILTAAFCRAALGGLHNRKLREHCEARLLARLPVDG